MCKSVILNEKNKVPNQWSKCQSWKLEKEMQIKTEINRRKN